MHFYNEWLEIILLESMNPIFKQKVRFALLLFLIIKWHIDPVEPEAQFFVAMLVKITGI